MDFKSLRAAKNKKAEARINSSGGKVDSSDWSPSEPLDAEAKTGMRPISRRAFKTGGKVDGGEAKTNLSRAPRGFSEKVGLANTNQKDANEEREGKKHVGGFARGGYSKSSVDKEIAKDKSIGGGEAKAINALLKGRQKSDEPDERPGKMNGGSQLAPTKSLRPAPRPGADRMQEIADEAERRKYQDMLDMAARTDGRKNGGRAEGSAKDKAEDKVMAKKAGMSMKDWEKSDADKAHDKGCTCKACGGAAMKKGGGGLYANIHAKRERGEKMRDAGDKGAPTSEDFKDAKRTARATGGRAKGKTNIVINVMPHTGEKPQPTGITPPMEPPRIAGPAPMAPPPAHVGIPPGLGAAMAGAAGASMGAPPGGPGPMMPPMARKSGGKVYPIHTGAGGGQARLDKIKAYGLKQQ